MNEPIRVILEQLTQAIEERDESLKEMMLENAKIIARNEELEHQFRALEPELAELKRLREMSKTFTELKKLLGGTPL